LKPVLVDSDILIEVFRARDQAILGRWTGASQNGSIILYSPVSAAELWHGVLPPEKTRLADLFAAIVCVPIEADVGRLAGDYLRQFEKSHGLDLGDALIAATASYHSVELWTRNRKHYPMKEVRFF
jgi:predicted nucleic acid-binding protein